MQLAHTPDRQRTFCAFTGGLAHPALAILAFARWTVRAVLAVILFGFALSALMVVSLAAMYSDRHVTS